MWLDGNVVVREIAPTVLAIVQDTHKTVLIEPFDCLKPKPARCLRFVVIVATNTVSDFIGGFSIHTIGY